MAVRTITRRGERRLIIDIRYRKPDGTKGRYRHDAEVQTMAAARAEERRRLAALAVTGSPFETPVPAGIPPLEIAPPEEPKPTSPCFEDVGKQFLVLFAPSHLKPSTKFGYKTVIERVLNPAIGKLPVDRIDASVVRELDTKLVERGVKPSTRRNVQTTLRSVLCRFAVEAKILPKAPELPKLPKVGRVVIRALTTEEVRAILKAANRTHRTAFMLAAFAGLRAGEIRGLRWRDIDLKAGTLIVRESVCRGIAAAPKSGHERVVPLTDELREELRNVRPIDSNALVSTNAKGKPWTESSLILAFRRTLKRAGLANWRLHDLRHYFVTALFKSGAPAPAVQALAGHADLSTTQRYAHLAQLDLEEAIAKFGRRAKG